MKRLFQPFRLFRTLGVLFVFGALAGGPSPVALAQEEGAAPAVAESTQEADASSPQEASSPESASPATPESAEGAKAVAPAANAGAPDENGMIPLNRKGTVKIDRKRKLVVIDGRIALRAGQLEMFACPAGTKEHESVVALDSDARTIHAGLLAIGARSGAVVKWDPQYTPAYGDVIEVYVLWKDADGKPHRVRGQSWVRDVKTGEELKSDWIFAGSGFWTDPSDGMEYYYADGGEAICVSNFPTAMIDLPIQSSQQNDALLFEAFENRIPPRGTPVRLVLRVPPNADFKKPEGAATPEETKPAQPVAEPPESDQPKPEEPKPESSDAPESTTEEPAAETPESGEAEPAAEMP